MSRAALDPPLAVWHQSDSAREHEEISPPAVIISLLLGDISPIIRSMGEVSLTFNKDLFRVLGAASPNEFPAAAGL